ncbi:indoleamine 2,3-dioxygenase family protein [Aspergillus clavatus NRRL 1]|uniref:Indoleamine 2,3-dioxygenase n=1 Tax=Aspergillus clavatus (strain ATCC 1007 / CBS 513.65 / DSM 816 / NCTC 3887 / NRRL 1 / QM 1276 / 107) TaxID=344612 RepID=A1CG37_ASPCL|nr:indoleamine 2,3-dioxygenase family protein [Aspergillus clavatus NRRL 1]EAW10917.1 indoleamine 2,3-dioxygenase family protein [Aspergillus clavatus NRRL 1]
MTQTKVSSASSTTLKRFPHIYDDPSTLPRSLDPFTITTSTGFLPYSTAPTTLPEVFQPLMSILDRMPVLKLDGTPGLLAKYELGPVVETELPDLTDEVDKLLAADGAPDLYTVAAVFRDYSFLASAYLLEPCWETWSQNPQKGYGLGRDLLPKAVARPMYRCAQLLDIPPFMSYAAAYSLFNYHLDNPSKGLAYDNLRLVRAFERGLGPKSSEAGFILTHVDMVKESNGLISGALKVVDTLDQGGPRSTVNDGFREILNAMEKIEASMEDMWTNSKPTEYLSFRVFIFGITSQSMFPNGVIYDGVLDNKPLYFRGESGANDSMIPLLDHLLQIPMPSTPLTKILHEFRAYRPLPHREFLAYINSKAEEVGVRSFAVQDTETTVLLLKTLNHVRSFRWRHWLFAREYIIKRTPHPTATGGSPIVTWLPNQLSAVMDLMISIYDTYLAPQKAAGVVSNGHLAYDASVQKQVEPMMEMVRDQREKLAREVERWCKERGV